MRNYRLRPRARNDLDRIWERTSEIWGRDQARTYLGKIKQARDLIASNPHIGRPREDVLAGLHAFNVQKHVLWYFVHDDHIGVVRILHSRMHVEHRIP